MIPNTHLKVMMVMNCPKCGYSCGGGDRFCMKCGTALEVKNLSVISNSKNIQNPLAELVPYTGQARRFTLDGHVIDVSSEMDAFIHYRKAFKHAAKYMRDILMNDYNTQVINLDEYFSKFPIMYVHYRRYLVDAAVKILVSNDIYDISREEFETELARDFSACNRLYESLIEAFNETIAANQSRTAMKAAFLPTAIFGGGLLGFAQAFAYNAASTAIVDAKIRNANVSKAQRNELFKRIDRKSLEHDVYSDFWDIHYSMTYRLNERGASVWYPTKELNARAQGLMNNINSNLIPEEKLVPVLVQILNIRPHQEGCLEYIVDKFRGNPEALALADYYGLEDEMGV